MPARQNFIVTSPGYTATKWLAWALNEHPDIYCTHSAGASPTDHDYSLNELDALVKEKLGDRDQVPLETFLERLESEHPRAPVVGNVHRYNLTSLRRNQTRFPMERGVVVVNLVRHPIDWVASGTAQMATMAEGVERIQRQIGEHQQKHAHLHEKVGMPDSHTAEDRSFAYLCWRLCLLAREAQMKEVRVVTMESMTSEPDVFSSLVRELSGQGVPEGYVGATFEKGKIHAHRRGPSACPKEKFEGWPPWRKQLFNHWAEVSDVFSTYAEFGYTRWSRPHPRPQTHPLSACVQEQLISAQGDEVLMAGQFGVLFSRERRRLYTQLRACTSWASGWGEGPFALISPGLKGGVAPLPPESLFTDEGPRYAVAHPHKQDRSPAIFRHHEDEGDFSVLNLKGAGLRCPEDTFIARAGRCPEFVERLRRRKSRPIELLFDHPEEEYNAHRLVGGAEEGAMLYEAWHALGWHGVLLGLDGRPGALPVPISVTRLSELPTPGLQGQAQPAWRYMTDPEWMVPEQMERLVRDIRWVDTGLKPWRMIQRRRVLRSLSDGQQGGAIDEKDRQAMGELYLRFRGPVIYAHASRAKLRIGHVWEELQATPGLIRRATELGLSPDQEGIGAWIRRVLREIHASNGLGFEPVDEGPWDLLTVEGRMACLLAHHRLNRDTQLRLLKGVGTATGRTLGALHGSGGHGLGRRLKLRNKKGRWVRDRWGMVIRAGAPGGGPTASRNVTVAGELMDLSMVSNPAMDWTARFARAWSRLDPKRCQPGHPRLVQLYQRCDVQLAEHGMTQLSAFITGNQGLVDPIWDEIEDARQARKRLEDGVRSPGLATGERARRIREIEEIEADIRDLRDRVSEFASNPALDAFQQAYDETFVEAAARYPRYGQENPRVSVE